MTLKKRTKDDDNDDNDDETGQFVDLISEGSDCEEEEEDNPLDAEVLKERVAIEKSKQRTVKNWVDEVTDNDEDDLPPPSKEKESAPVRGLTSVDIMLRKAAASKRPLCLSKGESSRTSREGRGGGRGGGRGKEGDGGRVLAEGLKGKGRAVD